MMRGHTSSAACSVLKSSARQPVGAILRLAAHKQRAELVLFRMLVATYQLCMHMQHMCSRPGMQGAAPGMSVLGQPCSLDTSQAEQTTSNAVLKLCASDWHVQAKCMELHWASHGHAVPYIVTLLEVTQCCCL